MKRLKLLNIILVVAIIISFTFDSFAGSPNRRGTAGATELLIPVGSTGVGMSGSILATAHGLDAIHWNPAGLSRSNLSAQVMFSNLSYIADIGVNYLAVSANMEDLGHLGVSFKTLSFGKIEETTIDRPEGTGITYSPTFLTVGLTYSRRMTDRIHFGTNIKMVYESITRVSATAFAFDLGLQYKAGETGFNFGVALKNLGSEISFDGSDFDRFVDDPNQITGYPTQPMRLRTAGFGMPTTLELGLAYKYPLMAEHLVEMSTTFINNNYSNDEYRFGVEYAYNNLFFIRGGYAYAQGVPSEFENIFGPTFGAGVRYTISGVEMSVDYAYRSTTFFSGNQWFSVMIGF